MAEKELRKMNRTELIEIIYALQQNDKALRQENEGLRRQLDDKLIRIEHSGSIAEAALSLNHIFEDAEAAAMQYLESIRSMAPLPCGEQESASVPEDADGHCRSVEEAKAECGRLLEEARNECDKLLEEAQIESGRRLDEAKTERDKLLEEAQAESNRLLEEARNERDELLEETRIECDQLRSDAMQQAKEQMETLGQGIRLVLENYPMLKEYLKEELKQEGTASGGRTE